MPLRSFVVDEDSLGTRRPIFEPFVWRDTLPEKDIRPLPVRGDARWLRIGSARLSLTTGFGILGRGDSMKRHWSRIGLCLFAAAVIAGIPALAEDRADVVQVRTTDAAMNAAIAEAQRTLPQFLALLADPPAGAGDFSFKYPLAGWEHIWVEGIVRRGNRLTGRLANEPMEDGFRLGQRVKVPIKQVSDWAYRDARGVMQGHRTTRALLPQLDAATARGIRGDFRWTR